MEHTNVVFQNYFIQFLVEMNFQQQSIWRSLSQNILIQTPQYQLQQIQTHPVPTLIAPPAQNTFVNKEMQTLVREMRFREKMQIIDSKKQRYKRSTNNCHKKYISILKNLLFLKLGQTTKDYILAQYRQYRNSRVYYFIHLCYLKWCLEPTDIAQVYQHFCLEVSNKVSRYQLEISMSSNENFINFRKDQILQMKYSLHSIYYFLKGTTQESIRILYQKNKYMIIKKNQYIRTLDIVRKIDSALQIQYNHVDMPFKLSQLNLQELYSLNNLMPLEKMKQEKQSNEQISRNIRQESSVYPQGKNEYNVIMQEQQEMYPLIGLQNSYQLMSDLKWYSWIIQKQKMLEFQLRRRQQQIMKNLSDYSTIHKPT